jgi:HAD superfamily phosphoserine phosphatase-like hydrolase
MVLRIKAIFCDMDGTAVKYPNEPFHSSWDALLNIFSEQEKKKWISIRDYYLKLQGRYDDWFKEQVGMLKGKKLEDAKRFLFPVPYSEGFFEFFSQNNGFKKAIVSSGIDLVAEKIVTELDFDDYIAQSLEIKDGFFTGKGSYSFSICKAEGIKNLSERYGLDLGETCYIGDSSWDISCFDIVGLPLAYEPKKNLEDYIEKNNIKVIKDFRNLEKILV